MEMLAVLLALFVYQVIIAQSQITIPFTSWSCNAQQNNPETLSFDFLRTENTDLLKSNKTKLNCNLNNNNYKKKSIINTQGQTKETVINSLEREQSKHSVDKIALFSPIKQTTGLLSIPNSTSQNHLSTQNLNPKDKITPQVSSLPLIEISKFDTNNALSTKYLDINYRDPMGIVSSLNKLKPSSYTEDLSTKKDLIDSKLYTVSEPTNKSTVNSDVGHSKDNLCACDATTKPYVPLIKSDVKTIGTPKSHTLFPQWLLTDQNRNKIQSVTIPQLALNIKENPFTTEPNILVDTVSPNIQNLYAHKDINIANLNNVPAPVKFTVNCDVNCALVFPHDGNFEGMNYVPMCPAAITSDVKNTEIPNYRTITPQFSLQDGYISKQQSGISPEIASNTKEKLIQSPSIILDNAVENVFVNKGTDSAKLNCASSVSSPTLIINNDLNCVKAYILQDIPTMKTVTTSEVKKVEMPVPQIYTSQLSFANVNKDITPIVTSAESATNINENFISALPNILADATVKTVKIASPLLYNDKGMDVGSNLLNNHMQNVNSKIENLSPITENTKESTTAEFSKPLKNMSNVIIPNIQMNVMPIINNNMAPVTQLNLKSYELQNEQSNGKCIRSLQMPHIMPITVSSPVGSSEIINFGLHQSNEPYKSLNAISIPQTRSAYIGPVSVPPDPSVYKTWSDKYTNCLRNSLNQFVSVLTSNILSAFKENCPPHKTINTFTKPVTKSNDIPSCIITKTPNLLNLPEFYLSPPLVESPKSLPPPKLNLLVPKISTNSEKINRSKASSQPYISSITINLSPSKDTTNNFIIMI